MKQLFLFLLLFLAPIGVQAEQRFDLVKMKQVYDNYTTNKHAGVTLNIGPPFSDSTFRQGIIEEQRAIKELFQKYSMEDLLILYDTNTQVHATVVQLAAQHDSQRTDQVFLTDRELTISAKSGKPIDLNYVTHWIQKTKPFEIELGPGVLSQAHKDQILRITDSGQIVMKGRAKQRNLLSEIRAEFEKEAGIIHNYTKEDDEFFFVIGYLKPDSRLLQPEFCNELESLIMHRRELIQLTFKVESVRVIAFDCYSLDQEACLWKSPEFKFQQVQKLSTQTLLKTLQQFYHTQHSHHESMPFPEAI